MHRFNNRSKAKFKSDIKYRSINEAEIALRLCVYIKKTKGYWPDLNPIGIDYTGELVKPNKVTSQADYLINNVKIEITNCERVIPSFHEKKNKVIRCEKDHIYMIYVSGFRINDEPDWVIISPKEFRKLNERSIEKYGENRLFPGTSASAYKYDTGWFAQDRWMKLPKLPKDLAKSLPKKYEEIYSLLS